MDRCGELFLLGKTNARITVGKVIEFYVPTRFSTRVKWLPPQQRGRVIEFRLPSMDYLDVLLQKIDQLRSEIADLRLLNQQYRLRSGNGAEAQFGQGQRLERLRKIQEELVQLSNLGLNSFSIEQMREKHRSRLHLVKQAS